MHKREPGCPHNNHIKSNYHWWRQYSSINLGKFSTHLNPKLLSKLISIVIVSSNHLQSKEVENITKKVQEKHKLIIRADILNNGNKTLKECSTSAMFLSLSEGRWQVALNRAVTCLSFSFFVYLCPSTILLIWK